MSKTISITFRIKGKNIYFEDKNEERNYKGRICLFYFGKLTYTSEICECCGKKNVNYSIIKNGFKRSRLTIPTIFEKLAYLILGNSVFTVKDAEDISHQKLLQSIGTVIFQPTQAWLF